MEIISQEMNFLRVAGLRDDEELTVFERRGAQRALVVRELEMADLQSNLSR